MSEKDKTVSDEESLARAKLVSETAKIPWQDLQRFFANGTAVFVEPELDLLEAAYQVSVDNAAQVKQWQTDGMLGAGTGQLALEGLEKDALVWSVVVRPWVLVQAIK